MYIMCLSKGLSAIQNALDEGVLPTRTLGFIPTAGDTYENPYFIDESRQRLMNHGIRLVEMDVVKETRDSLIKLLDEVDGIYIAGGNSFYLLYQLIQKDLHTILIGKVRDGLPYFGESAGAVILAHSIEPAKPIDDPRDAPDLKTYNGLGLIDFFPLPHVGKEKYKPLFDKLIEDNKDTLRIVQYTDEQAILTTDGSNYELLASSIEAL
jgi:dipeptidase E